MNSENKIEHFIAFLRGINVGGHHKVPMVDLQKSLEELGFKNIITLLNSGNVIFDASANSIKNIEKEISIKLEKTFGFSIPVLVRKSNSILKLYQDSPFKDVEVTKDIRLYISFLRENPSSELDLPWISPDRSFKILEIRDKMIVSILDLSISKTLAAMSSLEKSYGSDITTRNWNTIDRIVKKILNS